MRIERFLGLAGVVVSLVACNTAIERDVPAMMSNDAGAVPPEATPAPETDPMRDASAPDAFAEPAEVLDASAPPEPPPPPPVPVDPPPSEHGAQHRITERDEVVEQAAMTFIGDGYAVVWRSRERDSGADVVRIRFARLDRNGARVGADAVLTEHAVGLAGVEGAYLAQRAIAWDGATVGVAFTERNLVDLGERITTFVRVGLDGSILGEPHRVSRAFHRGAWLDAVPGGFALLVAEDFDTTITPFGSDGTVGLPAHVALERGEVVEAAAWNGESYGLVVFRATRVPEELYWFRRVALDGSTLGSPTVLPLSAYRSEQRLVATSALDYALAWHAIDEANPRRVHVVVAGITAADPIGVREATTVAESTAWHRTTLDVAVGVRANVVLAWISSGSGGYTGTPMFVRSYGGGAFGTACALEDTPSAGDYDVYAVAVACDPSGLDCAAAFGTRGPRGSAARPVVQLHARALPAGDCR